MSDQTPSEPTPEPTPGPTPEPTPGPTPGQASVPLPPPGAPLPPPGGASVPPAQWPSAPVEAPPPGAGGSWPAAGVPVPPPGMPLYAAAPPTSNNAVIAFILSIVSWALCPIIPAIVALILASSARREIMAAQGRIQGGGLVTAAKVISWINIGLWAAIIVIGGFVLVLAAVASAR